MRASSLAITRSAQSAKSLPPPTHQPCTWAITGFGARQTLISFWVGARAGAMLTHAGYCDVTIFERGKRVGGVRNHNTYPGELRAALEHTVWHTGCTSWYVDQHGNDPNQWPWLWSTYRRRTARLDPGAYELSGVRAPSSGAAALAP